jgi:hypothetical protein
MANKEAQITPEFLEDMVERVVDRITAKLEELDISLDYIAAAMLNSDALTIGAAQASGARGRGNRARGRVEAPPAVDETKT